MQQVLAFESDLLEYGDLFEGSKVVEAKVAELVQAATEELEWVLDGGGAFAMIDEVKGRLVQSNAERVRAIEAGTRKVVGVNSLHRDRAVTAHRGERRGPHPRASTRRPSASSSPGSPNGARRVTATR